jgi:hypothetical protein
VRRRTRALDRPQGTIDVWWNTLRNGSLMLLLAHLLQQNSEFRGSPIRLLHIVENESGRRRDIFPAFTGRSSSISTR